MPQNYLFETAFTIIFTLKPTIRHWTGVAKTFFIKNGQYSKAWQLYPEADDYLACTMVDDSSYSGQPSSKGSITISGRHWER
jgi:hypothetical protein